MKKRWTSQLLVTQENPLITTQLSLEPSFERPKRAKILTKVCFGLNSHSCLSLLDQEEALVLNKCPSTSGHEGL